jgi:cytochrome P450
LPHWAPTPNNARFRRALEDLDEVVYSLIDERRERGEDEADLLSMLLSARD